MTFQTYTPSEALKPYVQRFLCIRADGSTDTMKPPADDIHFREGHHIQQLFPCWGILSFVCNSRARVQNKEIDHDCFLVGTITQSIEVETLSGWFEALIVEFRPGGIRAFADVDMMQVHETVFGSNDVHVVDLHPINDQVQAIGATEEACKLVDNWLCSLINITDPIRMKGIIQTTAAAEERHCKILVGEMSAIACLSERQFSRSFRSYVGLTPKEFLRMLRWQMTIRHMQQIARDNQIIDYQEIALHMGYYDLSHMAMDFRAIGCTTPANFRQLGIPLTEDFTVFFG